MMRASVRSIASASSRTPSASGTGTGTTPFMRAKVGIMGKVGSMYASVSPGRVNARIAESRTSSDPQPVVSHRALSDTPDVSVRYAASSSRSSCAYSDGYREKVAADTSPSARSAAGGIPQRFVLSERSTAQGLRSGEYSARSRYSVRAIADESAMAWLPSGAEDEEKCDIVRRHPTAAQHPHAPEASRLPREWQRLPPVRLLPHASHADSWSSARSRAWTVPSRNVPFLRLEERGSLRSCSRRMTRTTSRRETQSLRSARALAVPRHRHQPRRAAGARARNQMRTPLLRRDRQRAAAHRWRAA